MKRLLGSYLFDPKIISGKMIFLTGPRQVGKTTFALNWLKESGVEGTYFNWDDPAVLQAYKRNPLFFKNVIDERHRETPFWNGFAELPGADCGKPWRNSWPSGDFRETASSFRQRCFSWFPGETAATNTLDDPLDRAAQGGKNPA